MQLWPQQKLVCLLLHPCSYGLYIVMAYIVVAYIEMAYVVMAYILMAHVVMAYIVMAYQVLVTDHVRFTTSPKT